MALQRFVDWPTMRPAFGGHLEVQAILESYKSDLDEGLRRGTCGSDPVWSFGTMGLQPLSSLSECCSASSRVRDVCNPRQVPKGRAFASRLDPELAHGGTQSLGMVAELSVGPHAASPCCEWQS